MRILITGSTGFIGRRLCRGLVGRDHEVIAFHRASSPTKSLTGLPVEHRIGDITSPDDIAKAMQGVDVVYHMAAPHSAQGGYGKLYSTIVEGTKYVLDAALEAGVQRVIYTSSAATVGVGKVPGKDQQPEVLDENHVWNLQTADWPFGYCKYLAEMAVQRALGKGLPVIVLNPSYILGPGDYYRKGHSLFSYLCNHQIPFYLQGGISPHTAAGCSAGGGTGGCAASSTPGTEMPVPGACKPALRRQVGQRPPGVSAGSGWLQ